MFESDKAGLHGAGDALADRCSHQSRLLYCSQEKTCLIYYWLCLVCIISTFNYAGMNHRLVIGSFKLMQRERAREKDREREKTGEIHTFAFSTLILTSPNVT